LRLAEWLSPLGDGVALMVDPIILESIVSKLINCHGSFPPGSPARKRIPAFPILAEPRHRQDSFGFSKSTGPRVLARLSARKLPVIESCSRLIARILHAHT
jgi:hypothetical protein